MGVKNSHLINAQAAAAESGASEEYCRLSKLIEESQAACPHPADQTAVKRIEGKRWQICKWCSKPLQWIGPMAEAAADHVPVPLPAPTPAPPPKSTFTEEILTLAQDLDDEWQCSGGVKYWSDEEKRSFIHRAAELAAMVLDCKGD